MDQYKFTFLFIFTLWRIQPAPFWRLCRHVTLEEDPRVTQRSVERPDIPSDLIMCWDVLGHLPVFYDL